MDAHCGSWVNQPSLIDCSYHLFMLDKQDFITQFIFIFLNSTFSKERDLFCSLQRYCLRRQIERIEFSICQSENLISSKKCQRNLFLVQKINQIQNNFHIIQQFEENLQNKYCQSNNSSYHPYTNKKQQFIGSMTLTKGC